MYPPICPAVSIPDPGADLTLPLGENLRTVHPPHQHFSLELRVHTQVMISTVSPHCLPLLTSPQHLYRSAAYIKLENPYKQRARCCRMPCLRFCPGRSWMFHRYSSVHQFIQINRYLQNACSVPGTIFDTRGVCGKQSQQTAPALVKLISKWTTNKSTKTDKVCGEG